MGDALRQLILPRTPLLISTAIAHYRDGPPMPSWSLRFHLAFTLIQSCMSSFTEGNIEDSQRITCAAVAVPKGVTAVPLVVPDRYLDDAQRVLETLLKPYENVIDDVWTCWKARGHTLSGEWMHRQSDGDRCVPLDNDEPVVLYLHGGAYCICSVQSHRELIWRATQAAGGCSFAINYRLSPQNEFPAHLHDALAAYMYLLSPPKEAAFTPIDPKRIFFAGDSAGGGLCLALALALRDAKLPLPGGIMTFSAWVDLTHSMPSIIDSSCNHTDYLPSSGIQLRPTPVTNEFHERARELQERINRTSTPQIGHESFKREERIQLYAANEALAIPYVSPLLSPNLGDLPPILLQTGDVERLRDENIYFAFKASDPNKFHQPSYVDCASSPFQMSTNVTLEVYDEMPHVFQLFEWTTATRVSYERVSLFVKRTREAANSLAIDDHPSIKAIRLDVSGQPQPLLNQHLSVLKWNKVGIVPSIERPEPAWKLRKEETSGIGFAKLFGIMTLIVGLMFCLL